MRNPAPMQAAGAPGEAAQGSVAAPGSAPLAIELRGVTIGYGDEVILSRLTLEVPVGRLVAVVGPPGAGKTTLLRCLAGSLRPRAGQAWALGDSLERARERVSLIERNPPVEWRFPLTLAELVMMGRYRRLGLLGRPSAHDWARVQANLLEVGLEGLADCRVADLTPGERRRALLARALVREPGLLLLDEPFDDSEPETDRVLLAAARRLCARGGAAFVATRSPAELVALYDLAILLNGRIVAAGPPSELLTAERLQATYGSHSVGLTVPAEYFAVDA